LAIAQNINRLQTPATLISPASPGSRKTQSQS
jgi:hypothetical protein